MRRLLCLILTLIAAASAQAIHLEYRYIEGMGVIAPNDPRWTGFNEPILIGGYYSPDALICRSYTTHPERVPMTIIDEKGKTIDTWGDVTVTNWGEIFVLTNYPKARGFKTSEQNLHTGFEAMRMWDVEVNLRYDSPIVTLPRLPLPLTNRLVSPMISQTVALYDYGLPVNITPPKPRTNVVDKGEGEYRLGMDYLNGVGHTKDPAVARDLFIKAAKKGQPEAMEQLRTNSLFGAMSPAETNKPPPKPTTEASRPDEAKAALEKRLAEAEEELRKLRAVETPPTTNAVPAATPVPKADEAATLAQLKEAHAALEKRLADSEEQLRKLRPPETQPKTSLLSGRWLWVVGILVVISALWLFNASRERAE